MPGINPDFALQSRLSFGRGARYAWALSIGALFIAFDGPTFRVPPAVAFARAGSFLLLAALPYGAIHVRGLDIGGRLDARRLTGRSPIALALALVGGSAWALLLAGAVLFLAGLAGGVSVSPFTLAALLAMGTTMAVIVLLLPSSAKIDSWLLLVLLGLGVVTTVYVIRNDRAVALGVLIVSAVICPWALPLALRRMRAAADETGGPPRSLLRPLAQLHSTTRPEIARAFLAAGSSVAVAGLLAFAGALSIAWMTARWNAWVRDFFEVMVVYAPLLLAGYEISSKVRHDHDNGGLDRIRLSGQPPWRVVLEMVFAISLPFVAVSAVCWVTLALVDPGNAPGILLHWPIVAGILVFGPLIGALRGRKPGLYLAASMGFALQLGNHVTPWTPGLLAVAAAVALAIARLERAGPVTGYSWTAAAVAASVAASIASLHLPNSRGFAIQNSGGLWIAGFMSLSAGVLFPDRTRVPGRTMVACALAVAIAAGIAEYYGLSRALSLHVKVHYGVLGGKSWTFYDPVWNEGKGWYAAIIGLNAAFGLILSCCALNQFRARARLSFALRATPMVVALLLLEVKSTSRAADANYAFGVQYLYNGWAVLELVLLAAMGAAAAVLIWREIRERRRFS